MESQQLIDALTAHISLYNSSLPNPKPNPNPRNSILRWFSSLSPSHRQSTLALTDAKFVGIVLEMSSRLHSDGHGSFFLLPDLPSSSDPSLPSLCFRRSRGLLSRSAKPGGLLISDSLLLFGSNSEEDLDSVTVDKRFVDNVDQFVEAMDGVSGGRFLREEEEGAELEKEWAEMGWLKEKGYYSLEAFMANRLEVVLRLAWRGSRRGGSGRKGKGGRGKEEPEGGVAAGVLRRKKGCVDWWEKLDSGRREGFCTSFLGKTANSLAKEFFEVPKIGSRNKSSSLKIGSELPLKFDPNASGLNSKMFFSKRESDFCMDTIPYSGMPHYLAKQLNKLVLVQEICAILQACQLNMVEKETLFFTRLSAALTIADLILRKLRGLIMVVSIEHINQELIGDEKLKTLPNKTEEKQINVACRKGKKKSRNSKGLNSLPKPKVNSTWQEPSMNTECRNDRVKDDSYCNQVEKLPLATNQKKGTVNNHVLPNDYGKGHATDGLDSKGHADKKKSEEKGAKPRNTSSKAAVSPSKNKKSIIPSVAAERRKEAKSVRLVDTPMVQPKSSDSAVRNDLSPILSCCSVSNEIIRGNKKMTDRTRPNQPLRPADSCFFGEDCSISNGFGNGIMKHVLPCVADDETIKRTVSSCPSRTNSNIIIDKQIYPLTSCSGSTCDNTSPPPSTLDVASSAVHNEQELPILTGDRTSQYFPPNSSHAVVKDKSAGVQNDDSGRYTYNHINSMGGTSYEWPTITPLNLTSLSSRHLPATTDILDLEVGHKRLNHFRQSLSSRQKARNSPVEGVQSCRILPSLTSPMSYDWPPVVKSCGRLGQTATISYNSGFDPPLPPSFCSTISAHAACGIQVKGAATESDRKHSGDVCDDTKSASELADDAECYWLSEEESETRAFFGRDYNQFFGGGVMYWNPAEHGGTGFSRPPSHSSEDGSWAWYEADLNRAIDDMVGMPGLPTSYNTAGLAAPPAAPFCSPFDPLGSGQQKIVYPMSANDGGKILHSSPIIDDPDENVSVSLSNLPGGVEGAKGDSLPYPRLRPIIIPNISRNGSRSEFKLNHRSPCIPSTKWDHPRIKRSPSPVVLCVPRVPRHTPPSPVGESRKRGFPIVRSGSSSPRHCGVRSWYNQDCTSEDPRPCLEGVEVVLASWGTKGLAGTPVAQSVQGSLLQDHLIPISQLTLDQEHPDIALPVQPPDQLSCPRKASLSLMHNVLHEEIDFFCKQVTADNLIKKPYITWAIKRVTRSLQVLWPRSRTNVFGSNATGLALPTSDVDLVVSLPPVRNLEPIKEAGILEGRNGIKETCLQHAARYLANQEWVRNDSLKTIENTAIPVIMLVVQVPHHINFSSMTSFIGEIPEAKSTQMPVNVASSYERTENTSLPMSSKFGKDGENDVTSIRLDISFKSTSHTGLQTSELVRDLTQQFPASVPLALVLKKFLADRSLDHSYSGGLSSYCLVLLITRFLQHEHHMGRPINHNLGSLMTDFLYFFGNVFDPRQMRISIQGRGVYMKRERGLSIDPLHIDDPLFPSNNVGRNCFRIHQCIKAFADAYILLENELEHFFVNCAPSSKTEVTLLRKIIPSIDLPHCGMGEAFPHMVLKMDGPTMDTCRKGSERCLSCKVPGDHLLNNYIYCPQFIRETITISTNKRIGNRMLDQQL